MSTVTLILFLKVSTGYGARFYSKRIDGYDSTEACVSAAQEAKHEAQQDPRITLGWACEPGDVE